jgi:hypothetical protein
MPGQGRKRVGEDVTPVVEGEVMPSRIAELDEPAGRDGTDELEDDAVVMNEDDDEEDEDEDAEDEDEDEDEDEEGDEDDEDADEDEDEDDEDLEDEDEDEEAVEDDR